MYIQMVSTCSYWCMLIVWCLLCFFIATGKKGNRWSQITIRMGKYAVQIVVLLGFMTMFVKLRNSIGCV